MMKRIKGCLIGLMIIGILVVGITASVWIPGIFVKDSVVFIPKFESTWEYEIEQLREQLNQQTNWLDGRTAQLDNRDIQFDERLVLLETPFKPIEADIERLQERLDVLEIPKPEPVIFKPDTIMQSVVHIEADAGWQGSGSYIGNGLILTAGHVVNEAYGFTITFEDGSIYESSIFYLEPAADVGFILIENCNSPVLPFDIDGFNRGDSVFVFGNPFGWDYCFSVTKGIVSSVNRDCGGYFGEKIMLQVDAAAYPGDSGGPVIDDEGEIIGILVGGPAYGADNIGLCIPVNICHRAMITYLSILEMGKLE